MENHSNILTSPAPDQVDYRAVATRQSAALVRADIEVALAHHDALLHFATKVSEGEEHRAVMCSLRRLRAALYALKENCPATTIRKIRSVRS